MIRALAAVSVLVSLLSASACSSVPVVSHPDRRTFSAASHEHGYPFFFWGFLDAGNTPNVREICYGKGVDQVSTVYTAGDILSWVFTLGIYSPRTVGIWCEL